MKYQTAPLERRLYKLVKQKQRQLEKPLKKRDFIFSLAGLIVLYGIITSVKPQQLIPSFKPTPKVALAQAETIEQTPQVQLAVVKDERVVKLEAYLKEQDSPLAPHAALLVEEADKYDIGWTKLVSISKMESDFGKRCPNGSHNAWGWGGSNFIYFESWEKAIKVISQKIGENYKLNEYSAIKAKYCPASDGCNPNWAMIVTNTSHAITKVEK